MPGNGRVELSFVMQTRSTSSISARENVASASELIAPVIHQSGSAATASQIMSLTGIRLWAQICAHLNLELRKCLITFLLFVRCLRLIARNDRELFSFNRGVSHLNDDVSRGSLLCYEILTNN
jgi:hypothetical protein